MDALPPRRAGRLNFWRSLSPLERQALTHVGTQRHVFKGDHLPAQPKPGMTILTAGCWVRLQVGNVPTTRKVIDLAAPGDLINALHTTNSRTPHWLGEMSQVDAIVLTKGRVLEVAHELVPIVLGDLPNIRGLIQQVQGEQQHFSSQIHSAARLDIDTRLARLLLALLYRFGERQSGGRNLLAPPLSQADLAAWIGASESSIWRALGRWRRNGVIHTGYSTLAILNPKEVRRIANSPDMPYQAFPATRNQRHDHFPGTAETAANSMIVAGLNLDTDLPPGL
jgi:CRP-like cAMP-binding protein